MLNPKQFTAFLIIVFLLLLALVGLDWLGAQIREGFRGY